MAAALLERSGTDHDASGELDPEELFDKVDGFKDVVIDMARSFRTKAETDITDELENAMKVVLAKVMDAFEQGDTSTEMYDHDHKRVKMEFFYEVEREESLTRWTRLSVASRCQKSDFHHFRLKGQW